jgi:hypothetical protein
MPIYALKCHACDHTEDVYRSIANIDHGLPQCHGQAMTRMLCKQFVMTDIQPYRSVVTGEQVSSRSAHREHLKRHRLVEIGNEKQPDFKAPDVSRDLRADLAPIVHAKARFA